MREKKGRTGIPSGLAAQAARRSVGGVEAVRSLMTTLEAEADAGFEGRTRPLDLRGFQTDAGLNARFLYGDKHKRTLKPEVERFIAAFNERWLSTRQPRPSRDERLRDEAEYWRERYLKLARHANTWHHHLRLARRQLRDLQVSTGSVLRLHDDRDRPL